MTQNTQAAKLNCVDQHIKSLMLTYPSSFPSRMSVLQDIFMSGGSHYEWNADGELVYTLDTEYMEVMEYSDLEARKLAVDELLANNAGINCDHYVVRAAAIKRCITNRQLIEADIDLYVANHVLEEDQKSGVEWMRNFDPQACVMRNAPYGALSPVWAAAAEETMKIVKSTITRHLGMYHSRFDRTKADAKWLRIYDQVERIIDKLDLTTGSKAREAELNAIVDQMLDEIPS